MYLTNERGIHWLHVKCLSTQAFLEHLCLQITEILKHLLLSPQSVAPVAWSSEHVLGRQDLKES